MLEVAAPILGKFWPNTVRAFMMVSGSNPMDSRVARLGPCICDRLGVDLGGSCNLAVLGSAWGVVRGLLGIEVCVGFFVELEGHLES